MTGSSMDEAVRNGEVSVSPEITDSQAEQQTTVPEKLEPKKPFQKVFSMKVALRSSLTSPGDAEGILM